MSNTIVLPVIIILGVLSGIVGIVIVLSCRCLPSWNRSSNFTNNEKYKRFFKKHCNIWWLFWALVIAHVAIALYYLYG